MCKIMLRPLSTYLLLIITCLFLIMSLNGLHLDNSVKSGLSEISNALTDSHDNCTVVHPKGKHALPVQAKSLIKNFDVENEIEIETDGSVSAVDLIPDRFNFISLHNRFMNVYTTYACTIIKIEFLDIFSPPPNS
jgi:hypothetical protein